MRVLIDTNVLISAALNPNGVPFQAYLKAASYPNHGLICEQNVDEIKRIFNKKFPSKLASLDRFLAVALMTLELVPVSSEEQDSEAQIRDADDRPILRAAIEAGADMILSCNKYEDTREMYLALLDAYNKDKLTNSRLNGYFGNG